MKRNHWLVTEREKRKMTQERVAELAGIERSYYTKIENGTVPSVKVAKRIANVFGIDWTRFFESDADR
ncbi:helix-turn-helix transcriptional regulator [Brevibacillus sp. SYP-B805]|uniref:helix-turn-helix domain-containing protein n=1 Tax=Brevibacillus sp. SYP-B805 TaxID=1578199 RepID=UPI0013EB198C|nr:helix-turn-helix transcriptional regulator [Brevibacillus sp. SYP-B805]NGQ93644.1 helix-turn-helix transcriptional regulator [Brevibacillus sp. SYP-B805]